MKKLKYSLIFIILPVISYIVAWFLILNKVTAELNNNYAGKELSISSPSDKEKYILKFSKATPAGFPFKWAIKIQGWQEEGVSSTAELKKPIIIGYNLLTQKVFAFYHGDIIARYKPIASGFGSKIQVGSYELAMKLPLTPDLIITALKTKDWFELINFVKWLEFNSAQIQIFDLVNHKKLYDEDHENIHVSFEKPKYYLHLQDFLQHIPQVFDVVYSIKINQSTSAHKITPGNFLYGFAWPIAFSSEGEIHLKTYATTLQNFGKDLEINLKDAKFSNSNSSTHLSLFYKGKMEGKNLDIQLKTDGISEIKPGFFDNLSAILQYGMNYMPVSGANIVKSEGFGARNDRTKPINNNRRATSDNAASSQSIDYNIIRNEIEYIINNKDKFKLHELENRKYDCNIDLNIAKRNNRQYIDINNFNLFSGNTGIRLKTQAETTVPLKQWKATGLLLLNNYPSLVDHFLGYTYRLGKFKEFEDFTRDLYVEIGKSFIKSISDHPESISNNISFDYALDSTNLSGSKFGSVEISNLESLYYLTLYKKASEGLKLNDKIKDKLQKFYPGLEKHSTILEQVLTNPKEAKKEIKKEIQKEIKQNLLKKLFQ